MSAKIRVEVNHKAFLLILSTPTLQALKEELQAREAIPLGVDLVITWQLEPFGDNFHVENDKDLQIAIDEQKQSGGPNFLPKFFVSNDNKEQQLEVETTGIRLSELHLSSEVTATAGNDSAVLKVLNSIYTSLIHLNEKVNDVHVLVERKTVQKDGSKATRGEYSKFFHFTPYFNEGWLLPAELTNAGLKVRAVTLISDHQRSMREKKKANQCDEVRHVQPKSRDLLRDLVEVFLPSAQVRVVPEWPYSCRITNGQLETIVYNGRTDAVVMSIECDFVALCWEVKNLNSELNESEITQTAAEVSAELDNIFRRYFIKPKKYTAVLTSGVAFLFIMALKNNDGAYVWRHSRVITDPDVAAGMMEGTFFVVGELLTSLGHSVRNPFAQGQKKEETDDGDEGGHDDEENMKDDRGISQRVSSFLTRSVNSALRGRGGKSSGDTPKKEKKNNFGPMISDSSYAPLTFENLNFFNKTRGKVFGFMHDL